MTNFGNEMSRKRLFEVDDFAAVVLAGNSQTRFAALEGTGNFVQHLLGVVVGFAQMRQNDVLKVLVLQFLEQTF